MRPIAWFVLAGFAALVPVGQAPVLGAQPPGPAPDTLTWLSGCWRDSSASRVIEEQWMPWRGDGAVGMGRTVRLGVIAAAELVVLRRRPDGLVYEAYPVGQAPTIFPARGGTGASVVFENLEHDFPQRIGYERRDPDSLYAWIEGPVGETLRRIEFRYRRVPCPA
jgi:hypothetical protein